MEKTTVDLYHHYPTMSLEKDKYMISKAKMKGDISKLQTERAVLASSMTRMQVELEDMQHHLAISKNQVARLSKLESLEKERNELLLENTFLRRRQMYQVTATQQAALSDKVYDCKCKEESHKDLEGVKRLLNSARKSSIQKIKSLMLDLEEQKGLLAEARRERSAATTQLIDLQNENAMLRSELKEAVAAAPPLENATSDVFDKVNSMEKEIEAVRCFMAEVAQNAHMFQAAFSMQKRESATRQELEKVVAENNKLQEELHTYKEVVARIETMGEVSDGNETRCVQNDRKF